MSMIDLLTSLYLEPDADACECEQCEAAAQGLTISPRDHTTQCVTQTPCEPVT